MDQEFTFKIVVVEDEELILNNVVKKIHEADLGFEVINTAMDGKAALDLIEKEPPDVILTDIRMPVMDGLDLLKAVSTRFPYIKKIVISGHDDFIFAQKAIKYDVTDYLLKPLKLDELRAALTRIEIILKAERSLLQQSKPAGSFNTYTTEEIVKKIELHIRENFVSDINFDKIAQEYNFSSSYLSKIFTKYFGENPTKYLILLRINRAKHMLLSEKGLSIKEIGERVGYPDQFYFSRIFKNVTGVSPAVFKSVNTNK